MGDWVYYVTYLRFLDVSEWIKKTDEIHKSEKLQELIQREIGDRVNPIVEYLSEQKERFLMGSSSAYTKALRNGFRSKSKTVPY